MAQTLLRRRVRRRIRRGIGCKNLVQNHRQSHAAFLKLFFDDRLISLDVFDVEFGRWAVGGDAGVGGVDGDLVGFVGPVEGSSLCPLLGLLRRDLRI